MDLGNAALGTISICSIVFILCSCCIPKIYEELNTVVSTNSLPPFSEEEKKKGNNKRLNKSIP